MGSRFKLLLPVVFMLGLGLAGCVFGKPAAKPTAAPVAARALRPTFTVTAERAKGIVLAPTSTRRPTMTPTATVPVSTATATATASPEPTKPPAASFTVSNGTVNVRQGPGTNYTVVGRVSQGEKYDISGKDPAGQWWQFTYEGQPAWITTGLVEANEAAGSVQVAANIPPAPTAAPRPAAPPAPTQPPAPAYRFHTVTMEPRQNTNNLITVWCAVWNNSGSGYVSGTIRVTGPGVSIEKGFGATEERGDPGIAGSEFVYNHDCKVEIVPPTPGGYTAQLIEGGQPISDPISFTVAGETRTFLVRWRQN